MMAPRTLPAPPMITMASTVAGDGEVGLVGIGIGEDTRKEGTGDPGDCRPSMKAVSFVLQRDAAAQGRRLIGAQRGPGPPDA